MKLKKELWYDQEEDIVGINFAKGEYWKSVELSNGVVLDISKDGTVLGLEIANAKNVFSGASKKVLQKAMVK